VRVQWGRNPSKVSLQRHASSLLHPLQVTSYRVPRSEAYCFQLDSSPAVEMAHCRVTDGLGHKQAARRLVHDLRDLRSPFTHRNSPSGSGPHTRDQRLKTFSLLCVATIVSRLLSAFPRYSARCEINSDNYPFLAGRVSATIQSEFGARDPGPEQSLSDMLAPADPAPFCPAPSHATSRLGSGSEARTLPG
jgi:hypothetical protein